MTPDLARRVRTSIMGHEGLMLRVYDDATGRVVSPGDTVRGWLTIGYGRNLVGRGITIAEADYLLANDLAEVESELNRVLPHWRDWTEPRRWAIFELGFNLGVQRFVDLFPLTVADLRHRRWESAASRLSAAKWRRQVGDSRALPIIRAIHRGTWT